MSVAVLGSLNLDIVLNLAALAAPGETVLARSTSRRVGGKGLNQAIAAARCGVAVSMAGALGDDEASVLLVDALRKSAISMIDLETIPGVSSGHAYISVAADGQNCIVVDPGANLKFNRSKFKITNAKVLLGQLETPVGSLRSFFQAGRGSGATTILNAAPVHEDAHDLLEDVDILIVNEYELEHLSREKAHSGSRHVELASRLRRPDQVIIVTLGSAGVLAIDNDGPVRFSARRVQPIDTVGAGDCFCGVFAAMLANERPMREAINIANIAAGISVTRRGSAEEKMPDLKEIYLVADELAVQDQVI